LNVHQGLYHAVASAVGDSAAGGPQPPARGGAGSGTQLLGSTSGSPVGSTAGSPPPPGIDGGGGGGGDMQSGIGGAHLLPEAALRVGQLLLQDFEAHGVHLQGGQQRAFIDASAREQMLCMQFGARLART